ncbi:uncharacterized protein [Typha latifolia]|uniref:uncharacterized protein n=1 Tax=Typha latifolia TaxID=4733 RepID=UPI003C2C5AB2
MLRASVADFGHSWDRHLPLIEFAYNNSYHSSIGMPPYEALYGRRCWTPISWDEVGERKIESSELIQEIIDKVRKKGDVQFGRKGKLSPRYIGPYEILERIGINEIFTLSVLKEEPIQLKKDLSYEEQPIRIIDRCVNMLRRRNVPMVKVLWRNHGVEEATWEFEEEIQSTYPHLR